MKKFRVQAFVASVLALGVIGQPIARAGQEGHGGRLWVCGSSAPILLDYQIARDQLRLTIDLGSGQDENALVRNVLGRIQALDPERGKLYLERAASFWARSAFVGESEFTNLEDMAAVPTPPAPDCELKQAVYQASSQSRFSAERRIKFRIARKLWDLLGVEDRAGLILHEIIYEDLANQGHKTADGALALNAWVSSREFASATSSDWQARMKSLSLGDHFHGMVLKHDSIQRDSKGRIASAVLQEDSDELLNSVAIGDEVRLRFSSDKLVLFYPDGSVAQAVQSGQSYIQLGGQELCIEGEARFYPGARLRSALSCVSPRTDRPILPFGTADGAVELAPGKELVFDLSGNLVVLPTTQELALWRPKGVLRITGPLVLDSEKNVISGKLLERKQLNEGGKAKQFYENEIVFLTRSGDVAQGGVYFSGGSDRFVRVSELDGKIAFADCPIQMTQASPESQVCIPIGSEAGYERKELKRILRTSAKRYAMYNDSALAWRVGLRTFQLGISINCMPGGAAIGTLTWASTPLVYWGVKKYDSLTARRRARNGLLSNRYLVTDIPYEQFRSELERSLSPVPHQ